jgi:hypothetical protein
MTPPPRPGGIVPPQILEHISKSKEATEEQRKAAKDTLEFDMARQSKGQSKGQEKTFSTPEGNTSGKAQK